MGEHSYKTKRWKDRNVCINDDDDDVASVSTKLQFHNVAERIAKLAIIKSAQ